MLNCLNQWCIKWRACINVSKSQVMHFRKVRKPRTTKIFYIGNDALDTVHMYKYLGLIIDEHVKFSLATETLAKSGTRALGSLINLYKKMKDMGFQTFQKLYQACICPVLDYSSPVWGHSKITEIESVHNRAMRIFLGVHRFAPIPALLGDTGWIPCFIRRMLHIVKYWNRLINMEDTRLTKIIFNFDYSTRQGKCWSNETLDIFKTLNIEDLFISKEACNVEYLDTKIESYFCQWWSEQVDNKPKLRMYKEMKNSPTTEFYVSTFLDSKLRSHLAQIRFGILPLTIETGRFRGTPLEERLCICCSENSIESEYHFIFECGFYENLRNSWFQNMDVNLTDFAVLSLCQKWTLIFSKPKLTAKFITLAMEKRRQKIYN